MAPRITFQQIVNATLDGSGTIFNNISDLKFRRSDGALPFGLDVGSNDRLQIGDRIGSGRGDLSLPGLFAGGFGLQNARSVSGAVTVTIDDAMLIVTAAATLNLPAVATMFNQFIYIKKTDNAGTVTVDPSGAETIDGETTYVFTASQSDCLIYSDGTAWRIWRPEPRFTTLIDNVNPSATSTGAVTTIDTSASTFFWGRPVLITAAANMRNDAAANEFMLVDFFIRVDAGANTRVFQWNSNLDDNHQGSSGTLIITPSRGNHTIDLRFQRLSGVGTATLDANDYVRVTALEL